jgi:hypothetical protein
VTRADLHVHTTASDGQLSPEAVVALAHELQLHTIAITDHDTTAGVEPALAHRNELMVIPGIELGSRDGEDSIDILGYFLNIQHPGLQQRLHQFQQDRQQRGHKILARLHDLGLPVDWARVMAFAGGDAIGRPHIAQALVAAGYAATMTEAFERYIGNGRPAYVARQTFSPEEAIQLIHDAGGAAVLAHPVFVPDFPAMVERLVPAGLDGIEVCYPAHTPELEAQARDLARRFDLVMTGGSDFHGPGVKADLGAALAPDGCVEALRERATIRASDPDNRGT